MKTENDLKEMLVGEKARLKHCKKNLKADKLSVTSVKARIDLLKYLIFNC